MAAVPSGLKEERPCDHRAPGPRCERCPAPWWPQDYKSQEWKRRGEPNITHKEKLVRNGAWRGSTSR
uniref:Uncharacterized protein n=1 Tax=Oryza nivara TaxID=4536 RepID=A0A0E0FLS1_ORYNI